ncbi:MAG TPA: CheR family methyltransferase [Methylomirabilota bacterium]
MSDDQDSRASADSDPADARDAAFLRLLDKLATEYQFDVREYKETSLARRIRSRLSQVRVESFADYITYLDRHPDEHVALFNAVLINLTGFFRDPPAWAALRHEVVPRLVADAGHSRAIRVWSAGCSTGEEPYSIAMVLAEHLGERARDFDIKIYGTDIDEAALGAARHGLYRTDHLKDVPSELVERYFAKEGQMYRFRRDMRRWCIFGRHNLAQDPPLSHIDLIACRNVLIYFRSELQDRILPTFNYALRESGFLFLGKSESLLARSRRFAPVVLKWRIFQRAPLTGPDVMVPPRALLSEVSRGPAGRDTRDFAIRLQSLIDVLPWAVILVDATDTVLAWNTAATSLFDIPVEAAMGCQFRDLDISYRIEGLRARVEDAKTRHVPTRLERVTFPRRTGELLTADISVVPLRDDHHQASSVVVAAVNTSDHARMVEEMTRIGEQHATAVEELQSTSEELETTNEELQSTNEELETTNEELQSTNEELETTIDELQATNGELATLNAALEERSAELRRLDAFHTNVVNTLEAALVVLDVDLKVLSWNERAAELWGVRSEDAVGRPFLTLPIGDVVKNARPAIETVLATGRAEVVPDIALPNPRGDGRVIMHLSRLGDVATSPRGVVLLVEAKR